MEFLILFTGWFTILSVLTLVSYLIDYFINLEYIWDTLKRILVKALKKLNLLIFG